MAGLWPTMITLRDGRGEEIVLRGLRRGDRAEWETLRARNRPWLAPWEATDPAPAGRVGFRRLLRHYDAEANVGRLQPFAIAYRGQLVGQMHLFGIGWGSVRGGAAGYWVSEEVAGRGIAPLALAGLVDHAFYGLGLHRVEVNIRPENAASLRVVTKLGFRDEGLRRGYLHIDGAWRDHRSFALVTDDLAGASLVRTWRDRGPGITGP